MWIHILLTQAQRAFELMKIHDILANPWATALAGLALLPLALLADSVGAVEKLAPNMEAKPAKFIARLQKGEPVTIVTLGTSITGGRWRWVTVMNEWLDKDFPGLVAMHDLGVGASASSYPPGKGGLDTVQQCAALKPDVVFIEFAVNDSYLPYKISLEDSRRNLNTMVDTVLRANPNAEIVVQTTNPVLDMPDPENRHATNRPRLADYGQVYREVAHERGLILVDNYPNWLKLLHSGREEYLKRVPDGIHPQEPGYREVVLPELKRVLLGRKEIP
jgi:acyl-CoA thioesterase-1